MAVLVDPPRWPAHGRLWSHLVSDTSLAELHALADRAGLPRRGFSGDHYDVPAELLDVVVAAGALPVPARELLARLQASGLRVPKRRGETLLGSWAVPAGGTGPGPGAADLIASTKAVPDLGATGGWLVVRDAGARVLVTRRAPGRDTGGPGLPWGGLPGGQRAPGEAASTAAVRRLASAGGPELDPADIAPCGYLRVRAGGGSHRWRWSPYFATELAGAGTNLQAGLAWLAPHDLPAAGGAGEAPPEPQQAWALVRHLLGLGVPAP